MNNRQVQYSNNLNVSDSRDLLFKFFIIGPSCTKTRAPCRASNEGDLPSGVGAKTWPLTCSCQETVTGVLLHYHIPSTRAKKAGPSYKYAVSI